MIIKRHAIDPAPKNYEKLKLKDKKLIKKIT